MSEFNSNELNTFLDAFTIPALVLDNEDTVIAYNNDFRHFFQKIVLKLSVSEIFDSETLEIINNIIAKVRYTQKQISDYLEIGFPGAKKNRYKVIFSSLSVNREKAVLLTFNTAGFSHSENQRVPNADKVSISTFDSEEILNKLNSEQFEIIERIRSLFPFTIIAKERILDLINKYLGYFWVLDAERKVIVVNEKFSQAVGIKLSQLEGKSISALIPNYLLEYYNSLFILVKNSLKCVQSEGVPLHGMSPNEIHDSYIVPIIDIENHVQGYIGIAYQKTQDVSETTGRFPYEDYPEFCFSMDISGNILELNKTLRQFLVSKDANYHSRPYRDSVHHLPDTFSQKRGEDAFSLHNVFNKDLLQYFNSSFIDEIKSLCLNYTHPVDISNTNPFLSDESVSNYRARLFRNTVSTKENNFIILIEQELIIDDMEGLLKKRGKMFDVMLKNNPQPIFIYTVDNLRFVEVNIAAEQLYGYTRDEFLRMDLTDLYTPEDIQTLLNESKQNKVNNYTGPFKHKKRNGTVIHVEIFKEEFLFEGKEAHFIIVKDITGRMNIEKDLQVFRTISSYSNDMVFKIDNSGFIQYCNSSAEKELSIANSSIVGTSIISFLIDEDRAKLNSLIINRQTKSNQVTITFMKTSKEKFEAVTEILPFTNVNNEVDCYAVIAKPVNKPEIIEKIVKVEKPVDYSGASVSSDFLSTVFHEILTPIHVILGFVQEIKDGVVERNPEIDDAINIISQNRVHLSDVMDSISEYIQSIETIRSIELSKFKLVDVINSLEDDISNDSILKNRNLLLMKANRTLEVISDKKLLQNTLWNIIKTISRISISNDLYISFYQFDESNIIVTFRDGENITPKLLKVLVSMIKNNDSNAVKEFGLSKFSAILCQKNCIKLKIKTEIVKKSGYDFEFGLLIPIEIADEAVKTDRSTKVDRNLTGTEGKAKKIFDIEDDSRTREFKSRDKRIVPLDEIDSDFVSIKKKKEIESELSPSESGKTKRLDLSQLVCLYMEDQIDSQLLFRVQMKELKDIKFALSFEEAEPLLRTTKLDFIVMDINLQGEYNGLDALKMIHRMPGLENLPIIAATAYILPGDKEKFIAAGFTDFVSKPIFREKIIESLEKIFGK